MFRYFANRAVCRSKRLCHGSTFAFNSVSSNTRPVTHSRSLPLLEQQQQRGKHTAVALQLDYYMSPQFAGIACALTEGFYETAGIHDLKLLSTCPVGLEPERVRQYRDISDDADVVVGSVEQNVLIPVLMNNPHLKVMAVAAMFRESPLCLVSLQKDNKNNTDQRDSNGVTGGSGAAAPQVVGAHEDTVDLLKRILIYDNFEQDPRHTVRVSPRANKITDLLEGRLDAIQAYTTTEVLTLERIIASATLGAHQAGDISTILLEGHNGARLGYSQVLFAPEEDLHGDQCEVLRAFLKATFEGWARAIQDPEHGARCVEEAQKMLKLSDEGNDHWDRNRFFEYNVDSTRACCDLVQATKAEDNANEKYGVIDPQRWDDATEWLLNENILPSFGLDAAVWKATD